MVIYMQKYYSLLCIHCITTASDTQSLSSGDIKELYETSLKPGHAAAFSDDCDSASSKGIVHGAGNQVGEADTPNGLLTPPVVIHSFTPSTL